MEAAPTEGPLASAPPFTVIAKRYPPEDLAEALAEGIEVGHSGDAVRMPQFTLEPADIDALIAYLEELRANSP